MRADELLDLAREAVRAAKGDEAVEAYAQRGRQTSIRSYEEQPEHLTSAQTQGLGVRLIRGDRLGYAYAADPAPGDVEGLVALARDNAACASPDEGNVLPDPEPVEPIDGIEAPGIERLSAEDKVRIAVELERLTRGVDPRVRTLRMCDYRELLSQTVVVSSAGLEAEASAGISYVLAYAVATDGDESQTGLGVAFARDPAELDLYRAAGEAAGRATRLLGARKPASERLPIVFDPWTAADVLGVLAAGLSGDAVIKGRSLFADKVGHRVGSETLTIVDDGRDPRSLAAFPFDDEGLPTRRTPLVENGVLRGFLHNSYTAARMATSSTANASRSGFNVSPAVAPHCLVVEPGTRSPTELLKGLDRALYVQDLVGVHSGANPITGDFSVGATGLLMERGRPVTAVREATIASTLLEILDGVQAVGDDLTFLPGAAASPTIVVAEMTVAGT